MGVFDGADKSILSPKAAFVGAVSQPPHNAKQFYAVVPPGAFAVSAGAWAEPNAMYYCCTMSGELLAVKTQHGYFQVINVLTTVPRPSSGDAPCVVDEFYAPIFRIDGRDPTQLYCIEGLGDADQFKLIYDELGFRGLVFERVWQG